MSKSSNTLLWVAGGVGLLYLLTKSSPAATPGSVVNPQSSTYCPDAAVCPASYVECGLSPTISSILAQF
jgi:hypothetical protein